MRKDRKQRRRLIRVISPTLAGCTPQFEMISKPRTCKKCKQCEEMICESQDEKDAQRKREPGKGFVKCRGNKDQYQA